MITKYNHYEKTYEDIEYYKDGKRKDITYKDSVMVFLSDDFKEILDKTKKQINWDKFISNCEKGKDLPYSCASKIKDKILNNVKHDIIKDVNPDLLNKKSKKSKKPQRPKERFLKPRPESLVDNKKDIKKDDLKEWIDRDPYESMKTKFNDFINESIDGVEKLSDGKIKYRNEIFPGFNKPKNYTGKGKYKKRVLAKEGDKIKIVNYGHSDYEDYTKHKDSERRKNFRKRHGCDPVSNLSKLTAKYWACQDLW